MNFVKRVESRERCAEAGWYAFDYLMDEPITPDFIRSLRPLGNFVYLTMLARPFFKIEGDYFFIKGVEGDPFFRVAVHGDHLYYLDKLEIFLHNQEYGKCVKEDSDAG